ncbi:MAG: septal ring lytic transglycosylase RlpA family protein [Ignavibacteriae bacterium]|nr:septal ring lytic transglycosylase RlpA family protein [Ignavibacteriota bacterium]
MLTLILINPISYVKQNQLNAQTSGSYSEYYEEGIASWYGPGFHGRKTASGEKFDTHELTAAHKTLPFGTILLVTNLENGKTTTVRINDRGPYARGRIIDLSMAAKKELEMGGLAKVRIEIAQPIEKSEPELSEASKPINLFEDVFPPNSRIYMELAKARELEKFNIEKIINTLKKVKIKAFTADSENDIPENPVANEHNYFDITHKIRNLKGYTLEVQSEFNDIDELIGKIESENFDTVFIVQINDKDSTSLRIFVGNFKNEYETYDVRKTLEDMKFNVKLVKI